MDVDGNHQQQDDDDPETSGQPLDLSIESHGPQPAPVNPLPSREEYHVMISFGDVHGDEDDDDNGYILGGAAAEQLTHHQRRTAERASSYNDGMISGASSRAESPNSIFADDTNNQAAPSAELSLFEQQQSEATSNEDDGTLCPICLDNWTSTGDHRICSLKCGHLFGFKCVNRWLQTESNKSCPTCKMQVRNGDLRYIYAKKLIALDTAEMDRVRKQLSIAIEERNRVEMQLAQFDCRVQLLTQEIGSLKRQLSCSNAAKQLGKSGGMMMSSSSLHPGGNNNPNKVSLYMDKSIEMCKFGGCRVFDTNSNLDLLIASIKSPTNLFSGYGLKKLNITTYKPIAFVPVHSLQIRDVCFHRDNNWVLTASMDKTFKVVDNVSNTITHYFHHQMPLWSCCWDANNQNVLYVGTQSGSVIKYDLRQLNEPVCTLSIEDDVSPVVSIASIPAVPGETLVHGGVISCKLSSLWVFENAYSQHNRYPLSLDGPFISMKYQDSTKQLLVSSRPNSRTSYSRHTLCTLEKRGESKIKCNIVHSFQGGGMQKLLSKSCFLTSSSSSGYRNDVLEYVAAHTENTKSVYLWSINTGEKVATVPAHESVLDLKGIRGQNGDYLASLTEKKLEFFKFVA